MLHIPFSLRADGGWRDRLMRFGARLDTFGRAHIHTYAPRAKSVVLCVYGDGEHSTPSARHPMVPHGNGTFSCILDDARPGLLYKFKCDHGWELPDPWSSSQPYGVHGPSCLVDSNSYSWRTTNWRGRPWHETVIYELHVGTFSAAGTFRGACEHLSRLAEIGFTAIQVMPICQTADGPNWGYDGVFPYAPDCKYGSAEDLKYFVDEAHRNGLQVILDVVYNHFGPEGNYLNDQVPTFFNQSLTTPWGAGLNFDGHGSALVREFVLNNALHWLTAFRFDGLRIDAPHMLRDESESHILNDLRRLVAERMGSDRHVHLILECHNPQVSSRGYAVVHQDAGRLIAEFMAARATGDGMSAMTEFLRLMTREPGRRIVPLETHDDIGNSALGSRVWGRGSAADVEAALAIILLSPEVPMLFMGDEHAERKPFHFFCRFNDISERDIMKGRAEEFGASPDATRPFEPETFRDCVLDLTALDARGKSSLALVKQLLRLRRRYIVPMCADGHCELLSADLDGDVKTLTWQSGDSQLCLVIGEAPLSAAESEAFTIYEHTTDADGQSSPLVVRWSIRV
jgi:maltooligosyltrehalose trehalohydrolase